MDPNNFRRAGSPPFSYHQPRPPIDERDYDIPNPYHQIDQFDGPVHPHPMGLHPMHHQQMIPHQNMQPPYLDVPPNDYQPDFLDNPRMHPNHRAALIQRELYVPAQPRSSSPPYKILCITNINHKISDGPVKDTLANDFGCFGDITVSICHDSGERLAYIYFRNYEDAREARNTRIGSVLFDRPIEIEPIYESNRSEPMRIPGSPATMMPPGQPMYSPRRRSMSPPINYPTELDMPPQRRLVHSRPYMHHGHPPSSPAYPHYHGASPPDHVHPQPHPASYPYKPAPIMGSGQLISSERRINYETSGYQPPSHNVHLSSPYSSPSHDHYRSYSHSTSVSGQHSISRADRERVLHDRVHDMRRSPRSEMYRQVDQRGPPSSSLSHSHHSPSNTPAYHSKRYSSHPTPPYQSDTSRHNYPPEPPMRFMSREYRREKFGGDHSSIDHEDGKPSRVLLVNNIDITKPEVKLREMFEIFGIIEDIEVKKVGSEISSALIRFSSMDGAYKAKTANNGRYIGGTRCRIVYGKVSASRKLWIGGLSQSTTMASLEVECSKYGNVISMEYTLGRPYCYIEFESANQAQFAAHHLKSTLTPASDRKIRVEFVDMDRSEKLIPRHGLDLHVTDKSTKSQSSNDPTCDNDSSPRSNSNMSGQKRGFSPIIEGSKRVCTTNETIPSSNTFKQERLVATAAARARSTSQKPSYSIDDLDKPDELSDTNELNNNSDTNQVVVENRNLILNQDDMEPSEAPSLDNLSKCINIKEVIHYCSVSWQGRLALKNSFFPAQIYLCSGSKSLLNKYLSANKDSSNCCLLSITQRWRLHPQPKLEVVKRRMQSGNLGILIITARQDNQKQHTHASINDGERGHEAEDSKPVNQEPKKQNGEVRSSSTEICDPLDKTLQTNVITRESEVMRDDSTITMISTGSNSISANPDQPGSTPTSASATQSKSLRNLISYLGQKDAAGVISLNASDSSDCVSSESLQSVNDSLPKLLYTFPPGDFALTLLRRLAPNITPEATKEEFLLGVISRGNLEGRS